MFNAYHSTLPPRLNCLFVKNRDVNSRHSKYLFNFKLQRPNTNTLATCLSIIGPKLWNNLPSAIKEAKTLSMFKRNLKRHNHLQMLH